MIPTIPLGPLSLPTKPVLILIGFYVVLWLGSKGAESLGIDGDHVWNWGVVSALSGLVLGRIAYALRYPQAYLLSPLSLISPRLSAFVPEVALLGGLAVGYIYLRRKHIPLGPFVDAVTPALVFGWAIYALANFLAGDAYGRESTLPWAIEMWGAQRHPVQLYEMAAALLTLIWLFARPAPRGKGIWGWKLLLAYSLSRLFLEAFRADSMTVAGGYRVVQIMALIGGLIALWGLAQHAPSARGPQTHRRGKVA